MDVKEAVRMAKEYISNVYSDEEIVQVGLEEVEFDDFSRDWKITIGFVRGWDWNPSWTQANPMNQNNFLTSALSERRKVRYYKVVRVHDGSGKVKSLTDRMLNDPK